MKSIEEMTASLWEDFSDQAPPTYCPYALKFQEWVERLSLSVAEAVRSDSIHAAVAVNQCKVLLVDKMFEWRTAAPQSHRNYTGDGHICILRVFDDCYRTLRAIELSLTSPLMYVPPQPQAAARERTTFSIADIVSFGRE